VLAGDIDVATARTKVQHYFGDIPPGPPLVVRERWIPDSVPASRIVMQDRVPQARIYKVWRGPEWRSDDTTQLELVDAVLTSGKSSRLYQRLVYNDQIATDLGAFPIDGEIAGGYVVYATAAEGQDLGAVERAIDEEMARFLRDGPTRAEIERVRAELKGSFIRGIEQVGGFRGKSQILAENAVFGGRPDFYRHSLDVMNAATPDQVRAAARRWLTVACLAAIHTRSNGGRANSSWNVASGSVPSICFAATVAAQLGQRERWASMSKRVVISVLASIYDLRRSRGGCVMTGLSPGGEPGA